MSEGFVADITHGGAVVPNWTLGPPERNIWIGVQLRGKPRSEVTTWRCNRCGFLESYAAAEPGIAGEARRRARVQAVALLAVLLAALGALALGIVLS